MEYARRLERTQLDVEWLINATPTGAWRNQLADFNILLMNHPMITHPKRHNQNQKGQTL